MGRDKRNEQRVEHYTKMVRNVMETPAWKALPTTAQALYPWLKLEWRGDRFNTNGSIRLSVRQAAERLGVSDNTAARAFHALQAKGFIVLREHACLGVGGEAKSPAFEITELPMPNGNNPPARKLLRDWQPGHDFPVHKARANNPEGKNGQKPKSQPSFADGNVINIQMKSR